MRHHIALAATTVVLLSGSLLSGCASSGVGSDPAAPSALAGDWTLVSGSDGEGDFDLAGSAITLTVDEDAVSGRAPCNGYSGTVEAAGATASFGAITSTRMACQVQALMDLERRYIDALGAATVVRAEGSALELGGGDGHVLRFEPAADSAGADGSAAGDSAALAGTGWTLTTLMHGDVAAEAIGAGSLSFSPDGTTLTGSAGCHDFSAGLATTGGVATLSGLDVAHQACGEETAAQEDSVFAVLGDGLVLTRVGDTLTAANAVDGVPVSLVYSFQTS